MKKTCIFLVLSNLLILDANAMKTETETLQENNDKAVELSILAPDTLHEDKNAAAVDSTNAENTLHSQRIKSYLQGLDDEEKRIVDKNSLIDKSKIKVSETNFNSILATLFTAVTDVEEEAGADAVIMEGLINNMINNSAARAAAIGKSVSQLYQDLETQVKNQIQNPSFFKLLNNELKNKKFSEDSNGQISSIDLRTVVTTGASCFASCLYSFLKK